MQELLDEAECQAIRQSLPQLPWERGFAGAVLGFGGAPRPLRSSLTRRDLAGSHGSGDAVPDVQTSCKSDVEKVEPEAKRQRMVSRTPVVGRPRPTEEAERFSAEERW
eukprot:1624160-Amphidinium_carterae.1